MNISENVQNSLRIIRQNKIRSFLTMLGIIIGITGVIVIISVGAGAQSLILNQIKSQGSNAISIFPGSGDEEGPPVSVMGIVIATLKYEDILALKDSARSPHVEEVTGYVRGNTTAVWRGHKSDTTFVGVSASLPIIEDTGVQEGDFFLSEDEKSLRKVAVLGSDVKKDLFGEESALGEAVKIGKHTFRVVGVMKERGTSGFTNQDNQIYVPLPTAQKLLLGIDYVSYGRAKVDDEKNLDAAMEDIKEILREQHELREDELNDFDVRSQKDAIDVLLQITNAIRFFLAAVAGIALLVGGIGIMNIMLVVVQERIREIGLRKAVGARAKHILTQFLVETMMITFSAGVIGILLGVFLSLVVAGVVRQLGYEWDFSISLFAIVLAVGVSSVIGLVFGLIPARRASRFSPIEALRYE